MTSKKILYNSEREELDRKEQFRKFIADQISLPFEEWDEKFKVYAQEKLLESQRETPDCSSEEEEKRIFARYLVSIDLREDDLKGKRILDLGCGEDGEFVKSCIDKGISEDCYGLDLEIDPQKYAEKYKGHLFNSNFEEEFPVNNFDYIFSCGAVMGPSEETDQRDPKKTILVALSSLKDDGEIRIYPIKKSYPGSELTGIDYEKVKWNEILQEFVNAQKIKYELIPIDIKSAGSEKDVWLKVIFPLS